MTTIDDGGPAFPVPMIPCDNDGGFTDVRHQGMSLRDWFAGQAMVGLLSNENVQFIYESQTIGPSWNGMFDNNRHRHVPAQSTLAKMAYEAADAMLAARKVTP